MTYALFTEGTGQGVHERSNVSALAEACVQDGEQRVHLETGPGTSPDTIITGRLFGFDALDILMRHYSWLAQRYRPEADAKILVFGFSRGALIARVLADLVCTCGIPFDARDARRVFKWWRSGGYGEALAALRREGRLFDARVEYLGVWDTVDSTVGIDGAKYRRVPAKVAQARHAVARDERRCFFGYEPMEGPQAEEMVFPGSHSDVGGIYPDNHAVADVALAWVAVPAVERGLRLKPGVSFSEELAPGDAVLHDSLHDATNVWGRLPESVRALERVRQHPICRLLDNFTIS